MYLRAFTAVATCKGARAYGVDRGVAAPIRRSTRPWYGRREMHHRIASRDAGTKRVGLQNVGLKQDEVVVRSQRRGFRIPYQRVDIVPTRKKSGG